MLEFLTVICSCEDEAINSNQECLCEYLFQNAENFAKIGIPICSDNGHNLDLILPHQSLPIEEYVRLDTCFSVGKLVKYVKEINYFIKLIELFAAMCKGKNYVNTAYITEWFPTRCLLYNMWNEALCPQLRAAFGSLFTAIYIDCYSRLETRRLETIRLIDINYTKKRITHKIMRLESKLEVSDIYLKAVGSGDGKNLPDEGQETEHEDYLLHGIKEDIIQYFSESDETSFNELSLELLHIAFKLLKFEIIGLGIYNFESKVLINYVSDVNFDRTETGVFRILMIVKKILFSDLDENQFRNMTMKARTGKSSTNNIINSESKKGESVDRNANKEDPIAIEGKHIQEYFNAKLIDDSDSANHTDVEIECKIKLLQIMDFVLDWRQDRLITNALEWFKNKIIENGTTEPQEIFTLIPPIIEIEHYEKENNTFTKYDELEIPDLSWIDSSLLKQLLKLFIIATNYRMQNFILRIVMRCFNQREQFLKNIKKISLITTKEDGELYNWLKVQLAVFSELSVQSEIWIGFYKISTNSERNIRKYNKVIKIFDNLEIILLEFSTISEGKPILKENSQKISTSRQNLIIHLNIHQKIINLIKEGIHNLDKIYDDPQNPSEADGREKLIVLFSSAFSVLTKLVINNKTNQKIFYRFINVFTRDLRMSLGQIKLIVEIFRDNYELCSQITENFLNIFIELIQNEGRQARFLEIFTVIQTVTLKPLPDVQRMVLNIIAESPNYQFLFYINNQGKFSFDKITDNPNLAYEDQPILYHCKLIESIGKCAIGLNNIFLTQIKCQRLLSIEMIFETIEEIEATKEKNAEILILKMPLLKFFYYSYIESEKFNEEIYRNKHIIKYFQKHSKDNDFSLEFIEIMIAIAADYSIRYIKPERLIYETFDDYNAILKFLRVIDRWPISFKLNKNLSNQVSCLKKQYDLYLKPLEIINESQDSQRIKETDLIIGEWNFFKTQLIYSDLLKNHLKSEKKALLNIIINIEDYLDGINFEEFLTKIVVYIRRAHTKNPPVDILLNCINFIISILSKISENKRRISKKSIQNKLCTLGLVKIILTIMCDKNTNKKIYNRLVTLSIQLLEGGNYMVQTEFYNYFMSSNNSEMFFKKIYNFLALAKEKESSISHLVYKTENDNVLKVLRFLQLLCENHNSNLQNYLRYQDKSNNNYNIIESIVFLFQDFTNKKKFDSFLILSQCIETLTELIQGPCEGNQKELLSLKFLDSSIELLAIDQNDPLLLKYNNLDTDNNYESNEGELLKNWMVVHLKYKLSITLLSLLEINKDDYIISFMFRAFSEELFQENLNSVYMAYFLIYNNEEYQSRIFKHFEDNEKFKYGISENPQDKDEKYYLGVIELGFNLYHLRKYLKDHERKTKNIDPEDYVNKVTTSNLLANDFIQDMYNLFVTTYADLMNSWKRIRRRKVFNVAELSKMSQKFFDKHTGRIEIALADSRIIYVYFALQPESLFLSEEIKANFHESVDRTSEKTKLQYLQESNVDLMQHLKVLQRLDNFFRKYPMMSIITSNVRLYYSLGFVVTIFLNAMLLASYTSPYDNGNFKPTFCLSSDQYGFCQEYMSESKTASLFAALGILHSICAALVCIFQILMTGPKIYKAYKIRYYDEDSNKSLRYFQLTFAFSRTVLHIQILYYIAYTALSFTAVIGKFYLIYSIHLFDVLYRFPSLQDVVKSIYRTRYTLALTFIFNFILIYYYSLWGYARLQEWYQEQCPNILICLLKTYEKGIQLGMGWVLLSWPNGEYNIERLFFDNTFYIVFLNVITFFLRGIIYDSFFLIRDETIKKEWDKKHVCFICGLDTEEIERRTNRSFNYHTEKEHNEWNYAFYAIYLTQKDRTEYTSIETYVKKCLDQESILWYPQKGGISFIKENLDEMSSNEIQINTIKEQLEDAKEEINEILEKTKKRNER